MYLFNLYLLLFSYLLHLYNSIAPIIYAGGCGIIDGILYHVGGNTHEEVSVDTVYALNLKDGFKLDSKGRAPWKELAKGKAPSAYRSSVVVHKPTKSLFVVGGERVLLNETFHIFDTTSKTWKLNKEASIGFPSLPLSNGQNATYSIADGTFVPDSTGSNFYLFGGTVPNNQLDGYETFPNLFLYNSYQNVWEVVDADNEVRLFGHTSQIYEGKMYVIGGMEAISGNLRPMDTAMVLDFDKLTWSNITIKGEVPSTRFGLSSVIIENRMIITGGAKDIKFSSYVDPNLYYIDLKDHSDLKWTKLTVNDFLPAKYSCLIYYNKHLINSFGVNGYGLATTRIVDMKTLKVTQALPAYDEKENDDSNDQFWSSMDKEESKNSYNNLPVVIGASLGGFAIFIISVLVIWYFLRKKSKTHKKLANYDDELKPPSLLEGNIWIDSPKDSAFPSFEFTNHSTVVSLDDDLVKLKPIKKTISTKFDGFSNNQSSLDTYHNKTG